MIQDPPNTTGSAGLPGAPPERRSGSPAPRRTSTATAATCAPGRGRLGPRADRDAAGQRPAVRQRRASAAGDAARVPDRRAPPLDSARRMLPSNPVPIQRRRHRSGTVKRAIRSTTGSTSSRSPRSRGGDRDRRLRPRAPARRSCSARATTRSGPSSRPPPRSPPARARRSRSPASSGLVGGVTLATATRRGDDGHRSSVRADLPQRDRAAAAPDAAQGHVPGARSGHDASPARSRRGSSAPPPPQPDIDVDQILSRWTPTRAIICCSCSPAAPRGSTGRAPTGALPEPGRRSAT